MIVKGAQHNNAFKGVDYLAASKDNEEAELIETRGLLSNDVEGMAKEMSALAKLTSSKSPYYHAELSPVHGEKLSNDEIIKAADILEKELGLEGHQRVVSKHTKEGNEHYHVFFNRVDPETGKAVNMGWNYAKHDNAARIMEKEFDLETVPSLFNREKDEPRPDRSPSRNEIEQAKKTGVNVPRWRKECKALAAATDGSRAAIIETLENHGHMVAYGDVMAAKGNKVPLVVLDPSGTAKKLSGTLGMKKPEMVETFGEINPSYFLTVEQARDVQQRRQDIEKQDLEVNKQRAAEKDLTMYGSAGLQGQQADALRDNKQRQKDLKTSSVVSTPKQEKTPLQAAKARNSSGGRVQPKHYEAIKTAPSREEIKEKSAPRYSQRESLKEDYAPAEAKRDRTEQTDRKREQTSKDIMKEIFERGRSTAAKPNNDLAKDNSWDRTLER